MSAIPPLQAPQKNPNSNIISFVERNQNINYKHGGGMRQTMDGLVYNEQEYYRKPRHVVDDSDEE